MTIKTRDELNAEFADGAIRGTSSELTAEKIRDLIASLGVGGTMFANNQTLPLTGTWTPVTIFTNSIDSYGIADDLPAGEFVIGAGADGVFAIDVAIGISYPAGPTGWLEFAITKNGAVTPYRMRRHLVAGDEGSMSIVGSGNLAAGDRVGLSVDAAGNGSVDVTSIQYRALRG
jgi:hypothetical protein